MKKEPLEAENTTAVRGNLHGCSFVRGMSFVFGALRESPLRAKNEKSPVCPLNEKIPNILVGTGVLDCPRRKNACFLYGYWYVAMYKAKIFCFRTVEDACPYIE